jgi:hypothetical protein
MAIDSIVRLIGGLWKNQTEQSRKGGEEANAGGFYGARDPRMQYGAAPQDTTKYRGASDIASGITGTPEGKNPVFQGFIDAENNQLNNKTPIQPGGFSVQPTQVNSANASAPSSAMVDYLNYMKYRS